MGRTRVQLSTGLPELDRVFRGLMPGDNIVWQVDSIEDYLPYVQPYCEYAVHNRQKLLYFRFADHPPLIEPQPGIDLVELHPERGFDPFLTEIHQIINRAGRGSLYLFDCLSRLAPEWNSDRMLGNFFMLTCPYLYDRAAIAYFAILRNYHSFHAVSPISNTTQILVDAYRRNGKFYIQPRKVQHRHSATMYMLHVRENDNFIPVTQSSIITETLAQTPWSRIESATHRLGFWSRTFAEAESLQNNINHGFAPAAVDPAYFRKLLRMLISRDDPVLTLAEKYFTLSDILAIRRRMIGTGLIGGKAVGMLLARAILHRQDPAWSQKLEPHDSFFVGADVFYTYLVQNGCWWMVQKHKADTLDDDTTETARRRILAGDFPEYIVEQFSDLLDYFGQSPIIVRSSSLLEDNFGNAFAGKYESVFCANQGGHHKRLEDFLCAVRTVYASTMSDDALTYRSQRGLLGQDEQMGLLIQRVSGDSYGSLFFPQAAGVAFSFNPYVWHETIDPQAGMMRLVFGIGTRAVDRSDDDYTRIVALNEPTRRPDASFDEVRRYAQQRVDVLDMEANQLRSMLFSDIVRRNPPIALEMYASRDLTQERRARSEGRRDPPEYILTFDRLLGETGFVADMRTLLSALQAAYAVPVDVEFTLNFFEPDRYRINLVQCRPLQVANPGDVAPAPDQIPSDDIILASQGPVIGRSLHLNIDWIIHVVPSLYSELALPERYEVARVLGEITHNPALMGSAILLLGPGRWATSSPELGVPVRFSDINTVSIICEIVAMRDSLVPDVSLGTHFFNELVENNMLYAALFPRRPQTRINATFLEGNGEDWTPWVEDATGDWTRAIRVIRANPFSPDTRVRFHANMLDQKILCYLDRTPTTPTPEPD